MREDVALPGSPAEEVTRLRECVNDLVAALTVPALSAAAPPAHVVSTTLDALMSRSDELIAAHARLTTELEELRRTVGALRANELSFQLTVDNIPGMVHTMTASGSVEFVNQQILDYFGRTREEINDWHTLVHPDDLPLVVERWTHSVSTGQPYEQEHRVLAADGAYRWQHVRGLPLRDTSGQIVRWYNLLTDVDERKRAEEGLRESEHESRLIVDTIPGLVAMLTPAGEIDSVNHQVLEYLGQPLEGVREWGTNGMVHGDDLPRVAAVFGESLASGTPYDFEARIRRFDGLYRWFQVRGLPLRDTNGRISRWYVLLTDIDGRKRAEDAIRASERNLKLIIDTIPALAWSARPDGSVEFFNQHFLDFIGLSAEQAGGWGWMSAVHPDDSTALTATWQRIMAAEAPGEMEARLRRHDGTYRWFLFRANPLRSESGAIVTWYGVNTDIEDRKRADEAVSTARAELARVMRVTALSALTASIAHEVNQPLSGIITNAGTCLRMLKASPPDIEGARETARRTIRDGNRVSDVIARLRSLFTKKEFVLEVLDLNEAAREVVALSTRELQRNQIVMKTNLADDLPMINGDRIQLQQVIVNLLRNASDAMADVHDRPRHLEIKTARDIGDRVRMTVRDVGTGLPTPITDSMFDAFYTTKAGGMGIGLFVSRSIVERHHGRLWAQSNDGPGATFSFSIPVVAENALSAADSPIT